MLLGNLPTISACLFRVLLFRITSEVILLKRTYFYLLPSIWGLRQGLRMFRRVCCHAGVSSNPGVLYARGLPSANLKAGLLDYKNSNKRSNL